MFYIPKGIYSILVPENNYNLLCNLPYNYSHKYQKFFSKYIYLENNYVSKIFLSIHSADK